MQKKMKSIPVYLLAEEFNKGIAIGKMPYDGLQSSEKADYSHRHDYHIFFW